MPNSISTIAYATELLSRRLGTRVTLSPAERELLTRNQNVRTYRAGATVRMEEQPSLRPTLIVSGWACREQISRNGRRQLMSILMPGDLVWSGGAQRALDLLGVVALTNLAVVNVSETIRAVQEDPASFPSLASGIARLQLAEEQSLLEQLARLGAQPAHQRIASVILELYERARSIGFVTGQSFIMPLTQECLGSLVGLSVVHVHRVLRRFKTESVCQVKSGLVDILDKARLARIAECEKSAA